MCVPNVESISKKYLILTEIFTSENTVVGGPSCIAVYSSWLNIRFTISSPLTGNSIINDMEKLCAHAS